MNLRIIITIISITFTIGAYGQREFKIPLSKPGEDVFLKVDIRTGPVTVVGTNRQDVLVRYESMEEEDVNISETKDGLKKISGGSTGIEVIERNNEITIETENWHKGLRVYLEVPRACDMSINTYHDGDISISDIDGDIEAETFHGPIKAMNIAGSLVANTFHGGVQATFREVTPDAPFAFSTYHGDVDVTFPASFKADMKIKTERGEIYTGFDIAFSQTQPQLRQEKSEKGYRAYVDGWIRGTVNGGGPEVMMKNHHGDVYIRKQ